MRINRSIFCNKSKNFCCIQLYGFAWIQFSCSHNKRLIYKHSVFPASGKDTDHAKGNIPHIRFMPLSIWLLLLIFLTDKLLCRLLYNILCIQLLFQNHRTDRIYVILILQDLLLRFKNCSICFTNFTHRNIIKNFQLWDRFFPCSVETLNFLFYIFIDIKPNRRK